MKYVLVFTLVVTAYVAGYLTPKGNLNSHTGKSTVNAVGTADEKPIFTTTDSIDSKLSSASAISEGKDSSANEKIAIGAEPKTFDTDSQVADSSPVVEKKPEPKLTVSDSPSSDGGINEAINDAEIDKLVPAPFNQYLKGNRGFMRDRYRKFVDQEQPADPDRELYNRLSDAILSNPYAKYLDIESMQCRAGLCEIRLYERKIGVWSYIQAEMSLQDWWKFNNSSAHGFDTEDKNKQGWYVLLTN